MNKAIISPQQLVVLRQPDDVVLRGVRQQADGRLEVPHLLEHRAEPHLPQLRVLPLEPLEQLHDRIVVAQTEDLRQHVPQMKHAGRPDAELLCKSHGLREHIYVRISIYIYMYIYIYIYIYI